MGTGVSRSEEGFANSSDGAFNAETWNVKGLTDEKIHIICSYMYKYGLDFICLQETHAPKADSYKYT